MALSTLMSRVATGPGGSAACLLAARGWLSCLFLQDASVLQVSALPLGCRTQHSIPERQASSVVPEAILRELKDIDTALSGASRLDGRQRASLPLSAHALPAPLPAHDVEPGLPSLEAHVRPAAAVGSTACKWLRRAGRVPGRIHSLPPECGDNLLLHFDEVDVVKMVQSLGRNGCMARVLQLNVVRPPSDGAQHQRLLPSKVQQAASSTPTPTSIGTSSKNTRKGRGSRSVEEIAAAGELLGVFRVKPAAVLMNAVTQQVEQLDLLYCPQDRVVLVDVPVRLVNDDVAPGAKKGGWMWLMKRTVRYKALGDSIPPFIELNVRHMDLDQDLLVRDMPIFPGTKLYEKDYNAPVVRCTTDTGGKD